MPRSAQKGDCVLDGSEQGRGQEQWESQEAEKVFQTRVRINTTYFSVSVLAYLSCALYAHAKGIMSVCAIAVLIILTAHIVSSRWNRYYAAARIQIFGVVLVLTLGANFDGQFRSSLLWQIPVAPLLAGYMLSRRDWAYCCLATCAGVVSVYLAGRAYPVASEFAFTSAQILIVRMISLGIFTTLAVLAVIGSQQQINSIKRKERALERVRVRAETAVASKARFLDNMSHEFRSPVQGILGTAAKMRELELEHEEAQACDAIHNCGASLLHLLTNVLDYSRFESNKLGGKALPFRPAQAMQECVARWKERCSALSVPFRCHIDCGQDLWLRGSQKNLLKIADQLLDNARRYGEKSEIALEFRCEEGPKAVRLELSVCDGGPGIPKDELSRLMAPFQRGKGLEGDNIEGIGLGLALACELARNMGGELRFETPAQGGTLAIFETELERATARPSTARWRSAA